MLALNNLRKNHAYRLINYGEKTSFTVLDVISDENYLIKTIDSLEILELQDLLKFGVSAEYILEETDDITE